MPTPVNVIGFYGHVVTSLKDRHLGRAAENLAEATRMAGVQALDEDECNLTTPITES
jgi:hypothetical protein